MRGISVNWRRALQVGAMVAAAIAALALLPSLLRAPEPPPLDPRIGLADVAAPATGGAVRDPDAGEQLGAPRADQRERAPRQGEPRREPGGDRIEEPDSGRSGGGRPGHPDAPATRDDPAPTATPAPLAPAAPPPPAAAPAPPPDSAPPPPAAAPAPPPDSAPPPQQQPPGITQFGP